MIRSYLTWFITAPPYLVKYSNNPTALHFKSDIRIPAVIGRSKVWHCDTAECDDKPYVGYGHSHMFICANFTVNHHCSHEANPHDTNVKQLKIIKLKMEWNSQENEKCNYTFVSIYITHIQQIYPITWFFTFIIIFGLCYGRWYTLSTFLKKKIKKKGYTRPHPNSPCEPLDISLDLTQQIPRSQSPHIKLAAATGSTTGWMLVYWYSVMCEREGERCSAPNPLTSIMLSLVQALTCGAPL